MIKEAEIKSYFDKTLRYQMSAVARKDAIGYNYRKKRGWFVSHLRGLEGSLLDVGCNVGNLEFFIREAGISPAMLQLTGIDIAKKTIDVANSRQIASATFQVGSALNLDFPDKFFNAVTLVEVIEHLPDQPGAIQEAARVLKPGGFLLLSTPNAECVPWIFDEHVRSTARRMLGRKLIEKDNPLTLAELSQILFGCGLEAIEGPHYYWYRPYHIFKGCLWWPPRLAAKGLLNSMKHCVAIEEAGRLDNEKQKKYCQSLVAAVRKPI